MCLKKLLLFIITIFLVFCPVSAQLNAVDQEKAEFYLQSAEQYKSQGDITVSANYYNKLAYLYWERGVNQKSIDSFKESLELNKRIGNQNGVKSIYFNLGMIYSEMEQYANAVDALRSGITLSQQLGQPESVASGQMNLGMALNGLGNHEEALSYLQKALQHYLDQDNLKLIRANYGIIAETYEKMGNTEKMVEYFDLFSAIDKKIRRMQISEIEEKTKVEINKVNQQMEMTQQELNMQTQRLMRTKDSLEKAELVGEKQRMELELSNLKIKEKDAKQRSQRMLIYGLLGILGIIFLFTIILLKLFADKKKANQLLDMQNKQIKASIQYAQRIQNAILPLPESMNDVFESFILYRPKDIVSGDFYWHSRVKNPGKGDYHFFAVVDCTGHGVPGAFMSMIGNTLLNEIVNEMKVYSPAKILTLLNEEVQNSLRQHQSDNDDGMDVCICRLEQNGESSFEMLYAGAKRQATIFKSSGKELITIEGDRKSVGGVKSYKLKVDFNDHELKLEKNDVVYLSSDGFVDQNRLDRKRFGSKRLNELFAEIGEKPVEQQKAVLENELDQHMQGVPQRDDITIMGIRII